MIKLFPKAHSTCDKAVSSAFVVLGLPFLKTEVSSPSLERVAPDLARTPDQGLFFVGDAGPISGRPLMNDSLTQTGDDFRNIAYRFSTCRLA
jgi:hypothetical protein